MISMFVIDDIVNGLIFFTGILVRIGGFLGVNEDLVLKDTFAGLFVRFIFSLYHKDDSKKATNDTNCRKHETQRHSNISFKKIDKPI